MCVFCEHNPQSHALKHVKSYFVISKLQEKERKKKNRNALVVSQPSHVPRTYIIIQKLKKQAIHFKEINKTRGKKKQGNE